MYDTVIGGGCYCCWCVGKVSFLKAMSAVMRVRTHKNIVLMCDMMVLMLTMAVSLQMVIIF